MICTSDSHPVNAIYMKTNKNVVTHLGWGLIALSLSLFLTGLYLPEYTKNSAFDPLEEGGLFMINFVISAVYFMVITGKHIKEYGFRRFHRGDERHYANALILFSISAHTLNFTTEIWIFAPYVQGMLWYVLLMHLAIFLFPYRASLPPLAQYLIYFINGAGLVLAVYLTIFLGPLIVYAIPLSFILGLSLHATVPLWFLIQFIQSGFRMEKLQYAKAAFWGGVVFPILMVGGFMSTWHGIQQGVEKGHEMYLANEDNELPEWVILSQHLPDNPLVERVLMSDARAQKWFWFGLDRGIFGPLDNIGAREMIYHDPLAAIARIVYGDLPFDNETAVHVLDSRYDARHMTHRRLWRGTDLQTESVATDIQVFADYRLAYVEKVLTIKNTEEHRWRSWQEAVYSFELPEGSVVTSLSLWIEGEERFSRLTTRGKADSAYVQIVGVESRDPALLHWQEGNRITVTVFPCTPEEDRVFKVGFTVPLTVDDDRLVLTSIPFDGPETFLTNASTVLRFEGIVPQEMDLPVAWNRQADGSIHYQGKYLPNWNVSFEAPPLSTTPFSFGGYRYQLQALQQEEVDFSPRHIILDINKEWNWFEMQAIWKRVKDKEVYVFAPNQTRLTEENHQELYKQLIQQNFSLLPLHLIEQPEQSLVISHSPAHTPNLSDLDGTIFADQMGQFLLQQTERLHWYNLGGTVSPYLRSLTDLRVVNFASGNLKELETLLEKNTFPETPENTHLVALQHSQIHIQKTADSLALSTDAPDHLLRLFAYNELMRDIGQQYFDREALEDQWLRKAEEAYVVSPVSSLVVLETQKDYERFGIDENRNSLGNASDSNSGAVPEPHEWVLIILVAVAAVYVWWNKGI